MYAIKLAEDGRILSATFETFQLDGMKIVKSLPDGDICDYKYVNGKYVYSPLPKYGDISQRIAELKQKLYDTDYIVIKIMENAATWEDYPNIKEERQAWRDEINSLQQKGE